MLYGLSEYGRRANKHQNNLFKPENLRIYSKIVDFRHLFEVENIANLQNYSHQYSDKCSFLN